PRGLQARDDRLAIETHDRAVADERGAASQAQLSQPLTDALERAGRDDDPIRSAAEIDVDDHLDFPGDSPPGRVSRCPTRLPGFQGSEIGLVVAADLLESVAAELLEE